MKRIASMTLGLLAALALLVAGCTPDDPSSPTLVAPSGTQVFAKYVAVGNSLTAGFMDGGLIIDGQLASVPRLIARQLGLDVSTTSEAFTQPYVAPPGVGSSNVGPAQVAGVLYWNTAAGAISVLGTTPEDQVENLLLARTLPVPYHNLGVPGAWIQDVTGTTTAEAFAGENPFFDLILRNAPAAAPFMANRTQLEQAIAKGPTLVTLWIGNNNILGPALTGVIDPGTGAPMTPVLEFQSRIRQVVGALTTQLTALTGFAPYIVVGNLQDDLPYFMPRLLFEQVIGLPWPGGYEDADVTTVFFPALAWAAAQDIMNPDPVPATFTLSSGEDTQVRDFIDDYNDVIDDLPALFPNVAVVRVNDLINQRPNPQERTHFLLLVQGGMPVATAAATTLFSLDGIHLNNRGYGLVANAFIDAINDLVGTDVPNFDWDTMTWDPTYANYQKAAVASAGAGPITPAAARAMSAVFRR